MNAGINSAVEENAADERAIYKERHDVEFYSKINGAVSRRNQLKAAEKRNTN